MAEERSDAEETSPVKEVTPGGREKAGFFLEKRRMSVVVPSDLSCSIKAWPINPVPPVNNTDLI
jgi:hypothetical protein